MNKKIITILLLLVSIFLTGCSGETKENQNTESENLDEVVSIEEVFAELWAEEDKKLKPICEQEMIPAESARDCYFRSLRKCDSFSGEKIPNEELEECMPYFLKELIENMEYKY